ncbi:hypothetical protein F9K33_06145 [bacterium]|nr:MAG: hypothetical protein F9K33_06145 [bacterium]
MIRFSVFVLFFGLCACEQTSGVYVNRQDINDVVLSAGFHTESARMSDGNDLLYGLWVPVIPQNKKVPLVIALHYAGPATPYRGNNYMQVLVQPALSDLGAIIVAPDAPGESWLDKKSEQAVMSFISMAIDEWPVDPQKIIITGYSMGGIGTWYYADKYSDIFFAAIPMASEPVGFLTGAVPHYVIQGQHDELFGTASVRRAVEVMHSNNRRAELVIADGLGHYEANSYVSYLQQSIAWITDTTATVKQNLRN